MFISYENTKLDEFAPSDSEKIRFLQDFPNVVSFTKSGCTFHSPGVFQVGGSRPVIVLPWFLRELDTRGDLKSDLRAWSWIFDSVKDISVFVNAKADLDLDEKPYSAFDLIYYSFLSSLLDEVKRLSLLNFHHEMTEVTPFLRGRWNVARDVAQGPSPTKFTCTFGSLQKDSPFFRVCRAFCHQARRSLMSRRNLGLVHEIDSVLLDVPVLMVGRSAFDEARSWIRQCGDERVLSGLLDFMSAVLVSGGSYARASGVAFKFEMDRFLEELVEKVFRGSNLCEVARHSREPILGGSVWIANANFQDDIESERTANNTSIPDVIVSDESSYLVGECKYKRLRVPFINDGEPDPELKGFSRNDRNQVLSFLMSLRPFEASIGKRVVVAVFFPCTTVEKFAVSNLRFPFAQLETGSLEKVIRQRLERSSEDGIQIQFVGINMAYFSRKLTEKDNRVGDELWKALVSESNCQEQIESRRTG